MKTIDASKWSHSLQWYYKHEGDYSAEKFCDDIIIRELEEHDEPFTIDFSNFKVGVSTQMVWIMGYYLVKMGYKAEDIEARVTFVEYDFKDTHEEFIKSVYDAKINIDK